MANTQGSGSDEKNRTFAPAGAGFNLEQFKNEVAGEIGMSLGRQGFGQGYSGQGASAASAGTLSGLAAGAQGTSAQNDFEASATLGQKKPSPAETVARQHGQKPSGSSK